ncbi:hypothetical protein VTI74DRAFT_5626 [Chaetomium olivicolor]
MRLLLFENRKKVLTYRSSGPNFTSTSFLSFVSHEVHLNPGNQAPCPNSQPDDCRQFVSHPFLSPVALQGWAHAFGGSTPES